MSVILGVFLGFLVFLLGWDGFLSLRVQMSFSAVCAVFFLVGFFSYKRNDEIVGRIILLKKELKQICGWRNWWSARVAAFGSSALATVISSVILFALYTGFVRPALITLFSK